MHSDIRALAVIAVRNSLIEDIHSMHLYTEVLRSAQGALPDTRVFEITMLAIDYFRKHHLDSICVAPINDLFGTLPTRFPNACHALSLLANSPTIETPYTMPLGNAQPLALPTNRAAPQSESVVVSGIDPRIDDTLADRLRRIQQGEEKLLYSYGWKGFTRNPEKLIAIIDYVLRHGGTVLTPNYRLSAQYVARREPVLAPSLGGPQSEPQCRNPLGLSERHRQALASVVFSCDIRVVPRRVPASVTVAPKVSEHGPNKGGNLCGRRFMV